MTPVAALILLALGCSRGPERIEAPDWDPGGQAEAAIAQLDKNSDQKLDADEIQGAPGLASGVNLLDVDKDGVVSREEIETLLSKYRDLGVGLRKPTFRITYKGRPVTDARVDFVPEDFLEGVVEPAHGVTDFEGYVVPQTEGQPVPGMRLGFYRVQVNSASGKIPAKYVGTESPLGANVSLAEDESSYGLNSIRQLTLTD